MQIPIKNHYSYIVDSRILFVLERDLPKDSIQRKDVLLNLIQRESTGDIESEISSDSSSKIVAIVSASKSGEFDLIVELNSGSPLLDDFDLSTETCDAFAGSVLYALKSGLIQSLEETKTARVKVIGVKWLCDITVQTPLGVFEGQNISSSKLKYNQTLPIAIHVVTGDGLFSRDILPSGKVRNKLNGVPVTCADCGLPVVVVKASEMGLTGMESIAKLNGNIDLIDQVARIRQSGRAMMGISSQIDNRLPIVILVAEPNVDANINVTTFLGTSFGNTLGILAAIGVASVFAKQGSVLDDRVRQCGRKSGIIGICDHFGTIFVEIELDPIDGQRVTHASVLRSIKLNRAILAMPSSSASELHSTSPRNLL